MRITDVVAGLAWPPSPDAALLSVSSSSLSSAASPIAALLDDLHAVLALAQGQAVMPLRGENGIVTGLVLAILGLILAVPLRSLVIGLLMRLARRVDRAGRCHAEMQAVVTIAATLLMVGLGAHVLRMALDAVFVLLPPSAALADTAAVGIVIAALGYGVSSALRPPTPVVPPFPAISAGPASWCPFLGALLLALAALVDRVAIITGAAPISIALAHGAVGVLEAGVIAVFLMAVGRSRDAGGDPQQAAHAGFTFTAMAWAALALGLAALVFGHVRFATLLFQELIWAALVAYTAALLIRLLAALMGALFSRENAAGRFATHIIGLPIQRIDQGRVLATALATVAIWLVALALILAPLGGAGASLVEQVRPSMIFDELRNLHIAPRTILTAALVLGVGLLLTRMVRRWLQDRFLPTTALDPGVRNSIVTGLSYAGALIALIAAADVLGIALDRITLIASALSVGIGFGLQSIIQNFVSGVILLIERPIKVGDWVAASGAEGRVRRISVRATEIAMADGGVAIVPNSSFITANVQNRTAAGIAGRIDVTLKVSGGESAPRVRDAILTIVAKLQGVRSRPAPKLLLTDAADGAFGFALQAYVDDGRSTADAKSELLYSLTEALDAAGLKASVS